MTPSPQPNQERCHVPVVSGTSIFFRRNVDQWDSHGVLRPIQRDWWSISFTRKARKIVAYVSFQMLRLLQSCGHYTSTSSVDFWQPKIPTTCQNPAVRLQGYEFDVIHTHLLPSQESRVIIISSRSTIIRNLLHVYRRSIEYIIIAYRSVYCTP